MPDTWNTVLPYMQAEQACAMLCDGHISMPVHYHLPKEINSSRSSAVLNCSPYSARILAGSVLVASVPYTSGNFAMHLASQPGFWKLASRLMPDVYQDSLYVEAVMTHPVAIAAPLSTAPSKQLSRHSCNHALQALQALMCQQLHPSY
eukprot:gene7973-1189_t